MKYLILYLLLLNLTGILFMRIDKGRARKQRFRISERRLFTAALAGGSIGIYTGMYLFRHKTKHRKFVIGIPLLIITQIAFLCMLISLFPDLLY